MAGLANRMAILVAFTVAAISASGTQNGECNELSVEDEVRECLNAEMGASAEPPAVQAYCQAESAQPCILRLTDASTGAGGPSWHAQPVDDICAQVLASDRVVRERAIRTSLAPYGDR